METPCPCLGTSTIEREEETGVLIWHILPPAHLLTPDYGPLPVNMYDLYNQAKFLKRQLHQISKDQVTIVILLEKKTYSCKFLPLPVRSLLHDLCHGWDLPWWLPAAMCSRSPNSYFLPFDEGFHIIKQCASDTIN